MARKDFDPDEIWSNAVEKIVKFIKNGESVVLLCSEIHHYLQVPLIF